MARMRRDLAGAPGVMGEPCSPPLRRAARVSRGRPPFALPGSALWELEAFGGGGGGDFGLEEGGWGGGGGGCGGGGGGGGWGGGLGGRGGGERDRGEGCQDGEHSVVHGAGFVLIEASLRVRARSFAGTRVR